MKVSGDDLISPGEQSVQSLATALYKGKPHVKGLMKIFDQITPRVTDEHIESFCGHWLKNIDNDGKFPLYKNVKNFMDNLYDRRPSKETGACTQNICDGSGHIEIQSKENPQETYMWRRGCKCVSIEKFSMTMMEWQLTEWQKSYNTVQQQLKEKKLSKDGKKVLNDWECPF